METKIRYLVDTNIWLERLLDQEKSEIVSKFFNKIPVDQVFISDFALHSIGVILNRLKKIEIFDKFIFDLFENAQIEQISLEQDDYFDLISNIEKYELDFDDSYQLTLSQKYEMKLITFDKDFNVEGVNKATPEEILGNQ